jgi:hypothetical protein
VNHHAFLEPTGVCQYEPQLLQADPLLKDPRHEHLAARGVRYMPHKPEAPTDSKSKSTTPMAPIMRRWMEKRRIIKVRSMVWFPGNGNGKERNEANLAQPNTDGRLGRPLNGLCCKKAVWDR